MSRRDELMKTKRIPYQALYIIKVDTIPGMSLANSSVIQIPEGWLFIGILTNYSYDGSVITYRIRGEFIIHPVAVITDSNFKVLRYHELIKTDKLSNGEKPRQFSDPRVFRCRNELWCIITYYTTGAKMALGKIDLITYTINTIHAFQGDFPNNVWQKNWCPFNDLDEFRLVYTPVPWTTYQFNETGNMTLLEGNVKSNQRMKIMGSTSYQLWKKDNQDRWLTIVHERTEPYMNRIYVHYFLYRYENKTMISDPFYLLTLCIEFILGLSIIDNSYALISFGIKDANLAVAKIDLNSIEFHPY